MSGITQTVDSLFKQIAQPYSAKAGFLWDDNGNPLGITDVEYTGDYSGDIWKEPNQLGKDAFLKLLVTQLKYQDPLSPMENSDFVAQLAQFRELETGENMLSALEAMKQLFDMNVDAQMYASQSTANASAMSLIGKEVRMRQVTVAYDGSLDAKIPIRAHIGNSDSGVVEIRNADGEVIRSINVSDKDAQNSATVYWDGRMDNGQFAKPGNYLVGMKDSERNTSHYTFVQAVVEGVRFTSDGVLVKIDGKEISIGEVLDVSMSEGGVGQMTQSQAMALMGKTVQSKYDAVSHTSGDLANYQIKINGTANTQVDIELRDASGRVVRTLRGHVGEFGTANDIFWDGRTDTGEMCPPGTYRMTVYNVVNGERQPEGSNPNIYAFIEGKVSGMTSVSGDYKLKLEDGTEIEIKNIVSISS